MFEYLSKDYENINLIKYMHPYVHHRIIYYSQAVETIQVPTDGWMDEEDIHVYNRILLSRKKDECLPFATTWIELEGIMLSEISQTEKDKYHMILPIHGILKKKKKSKQMQPHRHRLVITKGKRWGRAKWVTGVNWIVMARNYISDGEYSVLYTEVKI